MPPLSHLHSLLAEAHRAHETRDRLENVDKRLHAFNSNNNTTTNTTTNSIDLAMDMEIDPSVLDCLEDDHHNMFGFKAGNNFVNEPAKSNATKQTGSVGFNNMANVMLTPFDTSPESALGLSPSSPVHGETNYASYNNNANKNLAQSTSQTPVSLVATPVETSSPTGLLSGNQNAFDHQQELNNRGFTFSVPVENDNSFQFSLDPLAIEGFTTSTQETIFDGLSSARGQSFHSSSTPSMRSKHDFAAPPVRKKSFHKSMSFNNSLSSVSETPFDDFIEGSAPANLSMGLLSASIAGPRNSFTHMSQLTQQQKPTQSKVSVENVNANSNIQSCADSRPQSPSSAITGNHSFSHQSQSQYQFQHQSQPGSFQSYPTFSTGKTNQTSFDLFEDFEDYSGSYSNQVRSNLATPSVMSPIANNSPIGSFNGNMNGFGGTSGGHINMSGNFQSNKYQFSSAPTSAGNSSVNLRQLAVGRPAAFSSSFTKKSRQMSSPSSSKPTSPSASHTVNETSQLPIKRPLGQAASAKSASNEETPSRSCPSNGGTSSVANGVKRISSATSNLSSSLSAAPVSSQQSGSSQQNQNQDQECTNCHTKTTPLWRRNPQGEPLCNACGLFLKLHGATRPLSLKTDVIRKRNRLSSQRSSSANNGNNSINVSANSSAQNSPKVLSGGFDNAFSFGTSPGMSLSGSGTPNGSRPLSFSSAIPIAPKPPVDIAPKHVPIAPKPSSSAGSEAGFKVRRPGSLSLSFSGSSSNSPLPYGRSTKVNPAVAVVTATAEAQRNMRPTTSAEQWTNWR